MNVIEKFRKISDEHKAQFIVASFLTLVLLVEMPVLAWFANQRKIAELQMIKSPDLLYLTAANAEAVRHFEMGGINVEATQVVNGIETPVTHKLFPFCVAGDYVNSFTLQLVHTSNNPFTYEIYEGAIYTDMGEASATGKDYVPYTVTADLTGLEGISGLSRTSITQGDELYIVKNQKLQGRYLNMSNNNRTATTKYLEECYGNNGTNYQHYTAYELPLYWQCNNIQSVDDPLHHGEKFYKTFVLDVSWDPDTVSNDKETDIVYLMAYTGAD